MAYPSQEPAAPFRPPQSSRLGGRTATHARPATRRRALLVDALIGAALAVALLLISAGLGVAAFVAVPLLAVLLVSLPLERVIARVRRRRRAGSGRRAPLS